MAESDPPTKRPARKPTKAPKATKAQAEFARFKGQQSAAAGTGSGAAFASPLPTAAIPAWSLQPPPPPPGPQGYGPGPGQGWGPAAPSAGSSTSIVEGVGTTIRLGVEVLNAALSSSLGMLTGVGDAVGWGRGTLGYEDHCSCGDECGYDCCCVMGCGGCCEPSVGSCC
jgi:hypothetical protein